MATRQEGTTPVAAANRHRHTETSPVEIPDTYVRSQVALWEGRVWLMNPQRFAHKSTDRNDR